jgi:hypothetical protein
MCLEASVLEGGNGILEIDEDAVDVDLVIVFNEFRVGDQRVSANGFHV